MQETRFSDDFESIDNISKYWNSFLLWKLFSFLQQILEIPFITKLCDNIAIISSAVDVVTFDNIDVINFFERVDLPLEHLSCGPIFYRSQVNYFDGNLISSFLI